MDIDRNYLKLTIDIARNALNQGNFPIGSVLVNDNGDVLSSCSNENTSKKDITAHAEIQCLRETGIDKLSDSYGNTVLYTSLEPCAGCSFFIARTNVKKIISIANDPFRPGISHLKNDELYSTTFKDIEYVVVNNELSNKSLELMKQYFERKDLPEKARIFERAMKE